MDLLSQAIAVMRTGQTRFSRVECVAPWGRQYAPSPQPGVHVVLKGTAYLLSATSEPLLLREGDIVLLPAGDRHGMADSPERQLRPAQELLDELGDPADSDRVFRIGPDVAGQGKLELVTDRTPTTVMLCGGYQLERSRAHPLITELPEVVHLPGADSRHPELCGVIDLMARELEHPNVGSDAAIPALVDMLLLYVLRAWYTGQPCEDDKTGWGAALTDPAIRAALSSIHDQPAKAWTVDSLAAVAGLSRAAFARKFNALIGQPPLRYLTWWRMTLAARLLCDLDSPLSTVANKVGYVSEFAFANAFKREFGMSPGKYRTSRAA